MAQLLLVGLLISLIVDSQAQCTTRTQTQCFGDCQWSDAVCLQICFRPNTAFTGDMQNEEVTTRGSQELCKEHCANTPGCAHFTYWTNSRSCHLQDATASRVAQSGAVSGEPDCQEPTEPSMDGSAGGSAGGSTAGSAAGSTGGSMGGPSPGGSSSTGASPTGASPTGASPTGAVASPFSAGGASAPGASAPTTQTSPTFASDGTAGFAAGAGSSEEAVESMPGDVGSVMRIGRAESANSFSGLSSELSSGSGPLFPAVRSWGVVAIASGAISFALLTATILIRRGDNSPAVLSVAE